MKIVISDSYEAMSEAAANEMVQKLEFTKEPLVCIASGDTPTGLYHQFAALKKKGKGNIENWNFVGLDEWVGLNRMDPGSCGNYLDTSVIRPLAVPENKYCLFDGRAKDLNKECERVKSFIDDRGGIDVAILGLGTNGHLGLNEPGTDEHHLVHVSELAASTKTVGQKYFSSATALTKGITLGLATLMNARTVILLVNGAHKSGILQQVVEGPITKDVPGSILQRHKDCWLFTDRQAAGLLKAPSH